jgi:hypothetical protein
MANDILGVFGFLLIAGLIAGSIMSTISVLVEYDPHKRLLVHTNGDFLWKALCTIHPVAWLKRWWTSPIQEGDYGKNCFACDRPESLNNDQCRHHARHTGTAIRRVS